eukprot:431637_1
MGNRRSRTVHHHHTTTRVVRDDSAARNHQYRMEQLRDQRTAQSANEEAAKVNATRQHQYRMQQLDKQKQIEMQREAERQRAAKRAFDEKKKNTYSTPKTNISEGHTSELQSPNNIA